MSKWIQSLKEFPSRTRTFLVEVRGEWNKVTKPPRQEVIQTTVVVVVTSVVFAIYLWVSDYVIRTVYQWAFETLGLG